MNLSNFLWASCNHSTIFMFHVIISVKRLLFWIFVITKLLFHTIIHHLACFFWILVIVPVIMKFESISINYWYASNKNRSLVAFAPHPSIFMQPLFTFFVVNGTTTLDIPSKDGFFQSQIVYVLISFCSLHCS